MYALAIQGMHDEKTYSLCETMHVVLLQAGMLSFVTM